VSASVLVAVDGRTTDGLTASRAKLVEAIEEGSVVLGAAAGVRVPENMTIPFCERERGRYEFTSSSRCTRAYSGLYRGMI